MAVCCLFFVPLKASTQSYNGAITYKEEEHKPSVVLRSDGLYNTYDTSLMPCGERIDIHYNIYSPLYILNERNAIYLNKLGDKGTLISSLSYFKNLKYFQDIVGTISMKNTKIEATLPISLHVWGMRLKTFEAHFEGEVKNQDTIINWHMVVPYPKAPKKFNGNFKDLITPKLLYFIESKELSGLDSLYKERSTEQTK